MWLGDSAGWSCSTTCSSFRSARWPSSRHRGRRTAGRGIRSTRRSTSRSYADGVPTRWSAARLLPDRFREPDGFTAEHVFPWMWEHYPGCTAHREAAMLLAEREWPRLYDAYCLARNEVPVAATIYTNDVYVVRDFAVETAALVRGDPHLGDERVPSTTACAPTASASSAGCWTSCRAAPDGQPVAGGPAGVSPARRSTTRRSVTIAVMSDAGVTSNAGFERAGPGGCARHAAERDHLGGAALLDLDRGTIRGCQVHRRFGRDDDERDARVAGRERKRERADLVRRVAVGRDPVGADEDDIREAARRAPRQPRHPRAAGTGRPAARAPRR